jgi:tetratricopeptide (TPR) repeat protein
MSGRTQSALMTLTMLLACGCTESVSKPAPVGKPDPRGAVEAPREAADRAERVRFQGLLAGGKKALDAKQFDKALKDLEEAARLRDDPEARALLQQARSAKDEAAKAAYDQAMLRGNKALKERDYAAAIAAFQDALRQVPDGKEAVAALREAEFHRFLEKGRAALKNDQSTEAEEDFKEALKRHPEDNDGRDLLKQAQAKKRQQLLEQGKAALNEKKYDQAVRLLTEARDLSSDAEVTTLLTEANFQVKLQLGRQRVEAKEFAESIAELEAATSLKPAHAEARELLQMARKEKLQLLLKQRQVMANKEFDSWQQLISDHASRSSNEFHATGGVPIYSDGAIAAAREGLIRSQVNLYLWAQRLLTVELEVCDNKTARVAAYEAHLLRMKKVEGYVRGKYAPAETEAGFHRLEAEIMLEREKAK